MLKFLFGFATAAFILFILYTNGYVEVDIAGIESFFDAYYEMVIKFLSDLLAGISKFLDNLIK